MVSLTEFMRGVQQNAHRVTSYEWGADGSRVTGEREETQYENGQKVTYIIQERPCDCIGLIMGALELAGGRWPGLHGSNWAARNAIKGLEEISYVGQLYPGEIVFKAREKGESGYDLPSYYSDYHDQRDYYHVGVVTSVNPLEITHCTSVAGGIKRDTSMGQWEYGGKLTYVDYENKEPEAPSGPEEQPAQADPAPGALFQALVTAPTGNTVNLRRSPSLSSVVLLQVPIGDTVNVLDVMMDGKGPDGWNKVQSGNITGYMMRKFLQEVQEDVPPWSAEQEEKPEVFSQEVTVDRGTLRALRIELLAMAEKINMLAGDSIAE